MVDRSRKLVSAVAVIALAEVAVPMVTLVV